MHLDALLNAGAPPIVAILRGLAPQEAEAVGGALVGAGIRIIEVPLNSPEPFQSISILAKAYGEACAIGAGTVLAPQAVDAVAAAGGRLVVAPNADPAVIARALERGLDVMPGVMTPSEAFLALSAGARRLKLFPAASLGVAHLKALGDVVPEDAGLWAVGGTNAGNLGEWLAAGAAGVGVGGALFRPGDAPSLVAERARALVAAWKIAAGP
ncbi:2-dehydro-3-deoxy-6-phosphogalactonate aldolase [Amphiplicatus metriothermophilus]|uniref:2-keto-3-deoxy-phosphogalactonate aldolase n=1 Tax=Amphiplicatus metriothermophilus TaxID=1519374 RepID=A0A239PWZ8_9PROT|nr:2-dehydro-3-deoxy-6-phosphogalactonate aldolase [Amphiplicatus metriothermophilus]MBB5519644.1 2-dehydro-3-deoxyphosphogalactonate aldolase [Amphiplicatus metriothermophilus]SNT74207.1 2-keto-3-deoxy-phosphogalactonate aldolase [Amphiplicatus metriothermophilus]